MIQVHSLEGLSFEWDSEKAEANREAHGVSFEEAAEAFLDPFHQGGDASQQFEERQFLIGYSLAARLLIVIYTDRGPRIRVISAWPATRSERRMYEEA